MGTVLGTSLVAQSVKNLPTVQETQIQSPRWEDPLEKEIANHSSIPAWKIPCTVEPSRQATVLGIESVGHDLATKPPPQC